MRILDREEVGEYHLEVEAVDDGVPRMTSSAAVNIRVLDENDNSPVVVQPLEKVMMLASDWSKI